MAEMLMRSPNLTSSASWTRHLPPPLQGLNSGQRDKSRSDRWHSRPGPENLPYNIPSWLDTENPAESSGTTELTDSRSLNHNRRRVTQSAILALDCYSREKQTLIYVKPFQLGLPYPDYYNPKSTYAAYPDIYIKNISINS